MSHGTKSGASWLHFDRTEATTTPRFYFFLVFVYIHLMPTVLNTHVLVTPTTGSLSKSTFYRRLGPLIDLTAENLNLIRWANRLRRDNHVLHLPKVSHILFSTLHFSQS